MAMFNSQMVDPHCAKSPACWPHTIYMAQDYIAVLSTLSRRTAGLLDTRFFQVENHRTDGEKQRFSSLIGR